MYVRCFNLSAFGALITLLMTKELRLIRQGNLYIAINNYTLATQARVDPRVNGPVNKILFFIRYFLDIVHSFINVNMAGAASTNAATIML